MGVLFFQHLLSKFQLQYLWGQQFEFQNKKRLLFLKKFSFLLNTVTSIAILLYYLQITTIIIKTKCTHYSILSTSLLSSVQFIEGLGHDQREHDGGIGADLHWLGVDLDLAPRDGFVGTRSGITTIEFLHKHQP